MISMPGKCSLWTDRVINYACYQLPIARNSAADVESSWFLVRLNGGGAKGVCHVPVLTHWRLYTSSTCIEASFYNRREAYWIMNLLDRNLL